MEAVSEEALRGLEEDLLPKTCQDLLPKTCQDLSHLSTAAHMTRAAERAAEAPLFLSAALRGSSLSLLPQRRSTPHTPTHVMMTATHVRELVVRELGVRELVVRELGV